MGCAGGSVNVWLISTRDNSDVGEADKRRVDVKERSSGDAGPSADARVSIDVVERTDGDAGSLADARVSIDVEERTDGDDGSSAGARVSINVGERTDGDAESTASASVSIGNKHDLIDCDLYVVVASKFTLTLESIAPSRFNVSEDAFSSVSVDVTERFNCSSDIFCFFVADDEKKEGQRHFVLGDLDTR